MKLIDNWREVLLKANSMHLAYLIIALQPGFELIKELVPYLSLSDRAESIITFVLTILLILGRIRKQPTVSDPPREKPLTDGEVQ